MTDILIFMTALSLVIHFLICLTFFISCVREKERRAAAFGGLQHLYAGMPMESCRHPSPSIDKDTGLAKLDGQAPVHHHG